LAAGSKKTQIRKRREDDDEGRSDDGIESDGDGGAESDISDVSDIEEQTDLKEFKKTFSVILYPPFPLQKQRVSVMSKQR